MFYILHHSKGTLVLSATDRNQVVEWSKRQLGSLALTASVIESKSFDIERLVERGGTGLVAEPMRGCQPVVSITADMSQPMMQSQSEDTDFSSSIVQQQEFARFPVWH